MIGTHFSFEEGPSVNLSRDIISSDVRKLAITINFENISIEQELGISKTEVMASQTFIGEEDEESTEIDSILSSMKSEESLFTLKNSIRSECEEILSILKPIRNSAPQKEFSRSTPEFYRRSAKIISLQGKVIHNGSDSNEERILTAPVPQDCHKAEGHLEPASPTLIRPRVRRVPERVSNPFMKNFNREN